MISCSAFKAAANSYPSPPNLIYHKKYHSAQTQSLRLFPAGGTAPFPEQAQTGTNSPDTEPSRFWRQVPIYGPSD